MNSKRNLEVIFLFESNRSKNTFFFSNYNCIFSYICLAHLKDTVHTRISDPRLITGSYSLISVQKTPSATSKSPLCFQAIMRSSVDQIAAVLVGGLAGKVTCESVTELWRDFSRCRSRYNRASCAVPLKERSYT